jgi:hypothetical protein
MRNMERAAAILTCILATLGTATAAAQVTPTGDQSAVRVQADESEVRQAPRVDFRSQPPARNAAAVKARVEGLGAAVAQLDRLIASPRPARLSRSEAAAWNRHTAWLTSVRNRYQALLDSHAAAAGSTSEQSMLSAMEEMNTQFHELQKAVQTESSRYQTLSNAGRARHDAAMNTMRNLK